MKHYVILLLICIMPACRSHRSVVDRNIAETSLENKTEVKEETVATEKTVQTQHTTAVKTNVDEEITTIRLDTAGNIRSIQTTRRTTRQDVLADSTRQQSDVSRINRKDSIDTNSETIRTEDEHRESKSDSRLVQGSGWWRFVLGGIIITVLAIIRIYYKKK